jgi:hypothetical protein
MESASLTCGPGAAAAQALVVIKTKQGLSGLVIGAASKRLTLAEKTVVLPTSDIAFDLQAKTLTFNEVRTPIDPVSFTPARNVFSTSESVTMSSATPDVEIRYTTDGTQPTRSSRLYTGPLTITESTEFAARAYRLGTDGKALPAEDFAINGTHFSEATYGWFYQQPLRPALTHSVSLKPGLRRETVTAPWWRLYASLHWLPADHVGSATREMEGLSEPGPEPYGLRFSGFIDLPTAGVYTFHAPPELISMDYAAGYDLRVWIDDEEWYLTQWWHGRGTWSIPLAKGKHRFQVDFADARTNPWRKSGIWRYYPRPWCIYPGKPSDLLISGPNLDKPQRIPQGWLFHAQDK